MYRVSIIFISSALLLSACASTPVKESLPTEIVTASATQLPTSKPNAQSTNQTGRFDKLETISSRNWSQLQLLQTFPAEMPMNHSAVAIAPDGKTMVMGSSSGAQLMFFDLESGKILPKTMPIGGVANAASPFKVIKYLADGTFMANADSPYEIYHIGGAGDILSTWDGIEFALSADGKTIAFDADQQTLLVDIARNKTMTRLSSEAMGASFSPDDSKIAINVIGENENKTEVWNIANQALLTSLDNVINASYSPNGKFLVATSEYAVDASSLEIYTPDGSDQVTTLKANDYSSLFEPMFSQDSSLLAAQSGSGSILAWDTSNWQTLEMPPLQGSLDSISSDGRILVTRTQDGGVLIWGVLPN